MTRATVVQGVEHDVSEQHRQRAAVHARLAQAARTSGERRMQEDLADLHAGLATSARGRGAAIRSRAGEQPH